MGYKEQDAFITSEKKSKILAHIHENAESKGIYINIINAHREHVHYVLSLSADQSLSKVMQLIKGESSWWINKHSICKGKFEWADEYYAASISESHLNVVRDYIMNQEEHHRENLGRGVLPPP